MVPACPPMGGDGWPLLDSVSMGGHNAAPKAKASSSLNSSHLFTQHFIHISELT